MSTEGPFTKQGRECKENDSNNINPELLDSRNIEKERRPKCRWDIRKPRPERTNV